MKLSAAYFHGFREGEERQYGDYKYNPYDKETEEDYYYDYENGYRDGMFGSPDDSVEFDL